MAADHLVQRWFALTREELPALSGARGWPVHLDHCFQRILLDNATGGPWRDTITAPAYRNASDEQLGLAIAIGEQSIAGDQDMDLLNDNSLAWRGKGKGRTKRPGLS